MGLYAQSPGQVDEKQCVWYHTMDLPGLGEVAGQWDLRAGIDDYLGGVDISGERVLEIGPATGYVTVELERRGAEVVAAEVTDERGWDFVPQAGLDMEQVRADRQAHIADLKNTWWFIQRATHSHAQAYYGDIESLPPELGRFDSTFALAVLLHTRCPLAILEGAAKLTDHRMIVTDLVNPALGEAPVCALCPSKENGVWDTWWSFTPAFFVQPLGVLGFTEPVVTFHTQPTKGIDIQFFTVVAER
jgi:O-methyltransferase